MRKKICTPGGIRTPNLLIRSQMLYPLSYGRTLLSQRVRAYQGLERAVFEVLLHRLEQYFTLPQSRSHFLRHSNSNPQYSQVFGGWPFLCWAVRIWTG